MSKQAHLLSVVMPVRNAEKFLSEAVESILNQTFTDFELIIIDDGSTDLSFEIIQAFAKKDDRIRVVVNEKNIGVTKSLNKAIKIAQGAYIARMDADDISLPERFAQQIKFLNENSDVGLLGTGVEVVDLNGEKISVWKPPEKHEEIKWALCFGCPIYHPTVIYRSNIISEELYDEDFKHSQDYALWTKLIWKTKLANLKGPYLKLRKHNSNVTVKYKDDQRTVAAEIQKEMISNILERNVTISPRFIFKNSKSASTKNILQSLSILYDIFRIFRQNKAVEKEELLYIKKDSFERLKRVARDRLPKMDFIFALCLMVRIDVFLFFHYIICYLKKKIYNNSTRKDMKI